MTKRGGKVYQVVAGTRVQRGEVLATFASDRYATPATACLAWFAKHADKPGAGPMFFTRVK